MICSHITSRSNQWVRLMRTLGTSRRKRYEERAFICDGIKLLQEAIDSGINIRFIFVEQGTALPDNICRDYAVYTAPRDIMEYISTVECTQGVIFCCDMPAEKRMGSGQFILLDHLQDTGNLGTILRTADAFGISVVMDGCADPYNPKTVRAAMGSLFRVPMHSGALQDMIPKLRADGIATYAAVLSSSAQAIGAIDLRSSAVVIGNEGNGVSEQTANICDGHIILPMSGITESLNASIAAGIVMWEMQCAR